MREVSISIPRIVRMVAGPSHLSGSIGTPSLLKAWRAVVMDALQSCEFGEPTKIKSST